LARGSHRADALEVPCARRRRARTRRACRSAMRKSGGIATYTWPASTRGRKVGGTARTAAWRCAAHRSPRRRGCRSCRSEGSSVVRGRVDADGDSDVVHFLRKRISPDSTSHVLRILPRSGITPGTRGRVPACRARRPSRLPRGIVRRASGSWLVQSASLPAARDRSPRACGHLLARLEALLRVARSEHRNALPASVAG